MPKYNTSFQLNVEDMDLIESALRQVGGSADNCQSEQAAIHDLLGRLHDQKVFYRPEGVYVSG